MLLINLFSKKGKQVSDEMDSQLESDLSTNTDKKNINTRQKSMSTEETVITPNIAKPSGPSILLSLQGRTVPFVITQKETTIGRHDSNDIPIPEQTVTGKHAKILLENGTLTIVDLGSTNGTFVNGVRIRSQELKSGDRFRLGNVEMTLK
jgi:pSer/pThr/pTyr-binding forkhead associated (FHA) protein